MRDRDSVGASVAAVTAGESKDINGLLDVLESEFSEKSGAAAAALRQLIRPGFCVVLLLCF